MSRSIDIRQHIVSIYPSSLSEKGSIFPFSTNDITRLPFPWTHLCSTDRQQFCLPVVIADHRHCAAVQRTCLKHYDDADDDDDDDDDGHNDNDDDQKVIAADGADDVNNAHKADTGVVHPPQAHVWRSCMI